MHGDVAKSDTRWLPTDCIAIGDSFTPDGILRVDLNQTLFSIGGIDSYMPFCSINAKPGPICGMHCAICEEPKPFTMQLQHPVNSYPFIKKTVGQLHIQNNLYIDNMFITDKNSSLMDFKNNCLQFITTYQVLNTL